MSGCDLSATIVPGDSRCLMYRRSLSPTCRGCEALSVTESETVVEEAVMTTEKKKCACGSEDIKAKGKCGRCYDHDKWLAKKAAKKLATGAVPVAAAEPAPAPVLPPLDAAEKALVKELAARPAGTLLLPPPAGREIVLDFTEHADLYFWLQDFGAAPEDIIGLLYARAANQLSMKR